MKTYRRYMHKSFLPDLADEKVIHTTLFLKETGHRATILITDASDMPDFEPGDRVRMPNGDELDVEALYRDRNGGWCVAAYRANSTKAVIVSAACLTKIPRETTVTLRVTGPDHMVIQSVASYQRNWEEAGVRVERVEDDDEWR